MKLFDLKFAGVFLELVRPVNPLITALAVVVGGVLATGRHSLGEPRLWLAGLAAALVAAGGNALNDAYDAAADQINRPTRPVPSGRIAAKSAYQVGTLLVLSGTALGWVLSPVLGAIAAGVSLLLWGYNARWQHQPLVGNMVVAFCGGLPLVYGAIAMGEATGGIVPALFAFLAHLGREIVKDIQDVDGDLKVGARTLPIIIGELGSRRLAVAVLFLLVLLTPIPYLLKLNGMPYLTAVVILADLPLTITALDVWRNGTPRALRRASGNIKLAMLGGIIALYVG